MATRKLVTVVFADVVGSTQLGEMLDPEPLRELMLAAFRRIEAIVAHHGGTVEKFIGDAVMAVFGIPAAHEDDGLRALRAAVEMRGAVAGGDDGIAERHGITLQLRIGVNSGEVMTGGGRQTLVTGDAVNLAARLEQRAAPGEILVGPLTASLVGDALAGDPVGPLTVKGKQAPVTAVRLRTLDDRPRPVAGSRRTTPLIGRDDEVARLDAALDTAVARGGPVVVTVLGGAGVGKSRLVEDCLVRWRSRTTPFVGRCPPYGRGITYWPLREAVQRRVRELSGADADPLDVLADVLSDVPGGRELAAEVLGFVGLRPGAATGDGSSAVRTLLEVVSRHRPLVVVLDDAQWAEPGLLDLVEHVLRWWHGGPLLAVVLARPEFGRRRPDWPDVDLPNDTIRLAGLEDAAADRLARALLDDDADDRRAGIVHAAGGNPLFIEELARVAASTPGDELPVLPAGVRTLLTARLDALTPPRRAVLQRAAVIGESFEDTSLAALTPEREVPDLPRRLVALVEDDLLRSDAVGAVGRHQFRHLLLRDVSYESLPKGERARLHRLLADEMVVLADRTAVELDALVGHHLELAADLAAQVGADPSEVATLATRAGHALHRAGLVSQARGDVPGTVNLLTRATARLDGDDALPLALGTLGSALTEAGDLATARSVLDRAVEVAEQRGDERARTHAGLFRLWWESAAEPAGWTARARTEAGRAVEVATRLGDDLGLARAWVVLAEVAWSAARFADVEDALERATVHARSAGDLREEAENVAALTATAVEGPLSVAA
ncbi:AAA family ATPase, partial [Salsipaludibacter albus]|uniref:AAA family ATPase n=1 Tax=Salsipaludibacter albus TaxID=2849650 RepID=UPI001EE42A61|nr:AAA family ATPase [Salsipaludibacter albus]